MGIIFIVKNINFNNGTLLGDLDERLIFMKKIYLFLKLRNIRNSCI